MRRASQRSSLSRAKAREWRRRLPDPHTDSPPVCDYEGSDYQTSFWEQGGREYEDRVEAIALRRLLPKSGQRLLEIGAGAGRNTPRYKGYRQVVLLDYSRTQLQQAKTNLGNGDRYIFVAADVYNLPFVDGLFDAATMIRVLHHMADAPNALEQIRRVLQPKATFILEYANKQNIKAILRYWLGRQDWSPFTHEPVEFAKLNFDFHPKAVRGWLTGRGFAVERQLTVSHYRMAFLKRLVPLNLLVALDAAAQWTGNWWQLSPSVFAKCRAAGDTPVAAGGAFFRCPACGCSLRENGKDYLQCPDCDKRWAIRDGIYDFKEPIQ